jgi:hypothetical protein
MLAFLIPHKISNRSIYNFIASVDEIKKLTGTISFHNCLTLLKSNWRLRKILKSGKKRIISLKQGLSINDV